MTEAPTMTAVDRLLAREGTAISWADLTFNPWIGCQETGSPACKGCYARAFAESRLKHMGIKWGPKEPRYKVSPGTWAKLNRWQRIARSEDATLTVFCASLADVFDNAVDDSWRVQLGAEIVASPNLLWMLLTKRVGNAEAMLRAMFPEGVPENVALGVTCVTQKEVDRDLSRAVEVKHRLGIRRLFVSCEPLMEPLCLTPYLDDIDLVIVGGESGKNARPMFRGWVNSLMSACHVKGVPFHFKQWGEWFPYGEIDADGNRNTRTRGEKPGLWHEWPDGNGFSVRIGVKQAGAHLNGVMYREHFQ